MYEAHDGEQECKHDLDVRPSVHHPEQECHKLPDAVSAKWTDHKNLDFFFFTLKWYWPRENKIKYKKIPLVARPYKEDSKINKKCGGVQFSMSGVLTLLF